MTHPQIERQRALFDRKTRARPRSVPGALATVLAMFMLSGPAIAFDAYRLAVGDVLEISVVGMPDLHQRVPVQLDGSIIYPHIQQLEVAGKTLTEAQKAIQDALSSQLLRQRLADGREIMVGVAPGDVTATIAEYRPVYVSGDVARPGEQVYRPLMTVRQAISVAGGIDTFRGGAKAPTSEIADAQGERASVSTDLAKEAANIGRLRRELGQKEAVGPVQVDDGTVSPQLLDSLRESQNELFDSDQADYERERTFLKRSLDKLADQSQNLAKQQSQEEEGVKIDSEDVEKLAGLFKTGAVTGQRVNEARRAMLLSSTRSLQATSQLMQMTRQQEDTSRQMVRLDDQRRIKLLSELSERIARSDQLRSRALALDQKLSGLAAHPFDGASALRTPEIDIIRQVASGTPERIPGDIDAELRPGDVVEVSLHTTTPVAAASP